MLSYAARNHAFTPAVELAIEGAVLWRVDGAGPPQAIALAAVREVWLEFCPTRPERNRYRCRVVLAGGRAVEFFNRTYRGVYDFHDTSADYVEFVHALVAAIASSSCRFVAGADGGRYALSVAGFLVAVGAVALVLVFALTTGLWWLVLAKAALIAFYLPAAWGWLRRNREQVFAPNAVPTDVLPRA